MPKFFINNENIVNNKIIIKSEDYNHIKNVLRKKVNDKLYVCNNEDNKNYLCRIIQINEKEIILYVEKEIESISESNLDITIFQGLPKADKMELIIQKLVELGANKIVPTIMKRCITKIEEKDKSKKIDRWQKIAQVAAKQCGRDKIPKIEYFKDINYIVEDTSNYDIVLVAYEEERNNSIKQEIENLKKLKKENYKIAVIIGPEGGLEKKEVELLKNTGASIITLGKRILRTETVALSMCSILMYELGDLN